MRESFRAAHAVEIEAEMKEIYATGGGQLEQDLERLMPGASDLEAPLLV